MSNFAERLKEYLGAAEFNKLLDSLSGTERRGKFRFWQEALLARFVKETGIVASQTLQELLAELSDSGHAQEKVTREAFLEDPNRWFYNPNTKVCSEWIKEAWQLPAFRANLSYELARSASKIGDFGLARNTLEILSTILDEEQAVQLYVFIRDESNRLESEWRPEFEEAFPQGLFVALRG